MKRIEADKTISSIIKAIEKRDLDFAYSQIIKFSDAFKDSTDPEDCFDYTTISLYGRAYGCICELEQLILNEDYWQEVKKLKNEVKNIFTLKYLEELEDELEKEDKELDIF